MKTSKSKTMAHVVILILVLITMAVLSGTFQNYGQQQTSKPNPTPNLEKWDLDKYAVADYNEPEPTDPNEQEKKKAKGKRYDNEHLVFKYPHPGTTATILFNESPLPPTIPVIESDLIVIGEIIDLKASLSNNKKGIYSEYEVRVFETLKDDRLRNLKMERSIWVDRAGGYVRYANNQKVLYLIDGKDLPRVGGRYLLFLTNKDRGPNYAILTGYELKQSEVVRLDDSIPLTKFSGKGEQYFVDAVRREISGQ